MSTLFIPHHLESMFEGSILDYEERSHTCTHVELDLETQVSPTT